MSTTDPVIWIFSTGTEILQGHATDRNSPTISGRLLEAGLPTARHVAIADRADALQEALTEASARADLIITTGGLGPTGDDLNRHVVAAVWGRALVEDPDSLERIRARYQRRGRVMPESNRVQALIPAGAEVLSNENGTAPGFYLEPGPDGPRATLIALPGPPREMAPMLDKEALPRILRRFGVERVRFRAINYHTACIAESAINELVHDLFAYDERVNFALLAKMSLVDIRLTLMARDEAANDELQARWEALVRERLGEYNIFGCDNDTLESVVGGLLRERRQTLTTAESCTGGRLAGRITDVAGSSEYFREGFITYANEAKMARMGVMPDLLARFGAVSAEVAEAMATGAREVAGTDWAVSITGIAGPGGGSPDKPVGLVYLGLAGPDGIVHSRRHHFLGDRADVRHQAVVAALDLLRRGLLGAPLDPVLPAQAVRQDR
ncbi:MAG TPA: competence/damage-inducible protein A [Candidatus Sumerlaeota bacterium]|nr:competence/damage-inducible protein A [Candidatus Sumerlaeota bacterium]